MPDELVPCDTSVLDDLIEATRQEAVLDEFRRRADQSKDKVDDAVYRRVMDDYAARLQALEAGTEPLRARARAEFAKLRAACERLEDAQSRARLDKQELEFRAEIGEIDAAALADQLREPAAKLEECRTELARLDTHKARFVAAFGSEESLLDLPTRRLAAGQVADAKGTPRARVQVEGEGADAGVYALGAVARIGRSEDNDICIQSRGISRHHAVITATVQGFLLRDLGSQNGTVVNGERGVERMLADGDQIALGDGRLRFSFTPSGGKAGRAVR
jgi:predicted component of type VI protein secretion system